MLKICFVLVLSLTVANCESWFDSWSQLFGQPEGSKGDSRVIGGETSPVHYPYQISLQMQSRSGGGGLFPIFQPSPSNWSHFCGGSVVNENYIVTAAHCIQGFNTSRMSVLAGTKDLRKESDGSRHLIDNCTIHPDYVELNNSDISVCRLQTPFVLGKNIAPIALSKDYVLGGENCTLTGWGYTTQLSFLPLPNELQRLNVPTITNEDCNQRGHNVGRKEICTLSRIGQGACNGDSGGPLQCKNVLVGIVSYGTRVCAVNLPDVFTRASEFVDWIEENTK